MRVHYVEVVWDELSIVEWLDVNDWFVDACWTVKNMLFFTKLYNGSMNISKFTISEYEAMINLQEHNMTRK